jgi:hypothetical protein
MLNRHDYRRKKDTREVASDPFARLNAEIRLNMILWMFVFWVGQVALNVWVVLTIFHATKLR